MKISKGLLAKCAVIGGIVLVLWGMFSWMVLPWHHAIVQRFDNEKAVSQVIVDNAPKSGIYALPNMQFSKEGMSKEEIQEMKAEERAMMESGPMMLVFFRMEGMTRGNLVTTLIYGFLIQAVAALLATWLVLHAKGLSYWKTVCLFAALGLFAGIVAELPLWNWWRFPFCATIVFMLDYLIGWFLAGLVIARLLKK